MGNPSFKLNPTLFSTAEEIVFIDFPASKAYTPAFIRSSKLVVFTKLIRLELSIFVQSLNPQN